MQNELYKPLKILFVIGLVSEHVIGLVGLIDYQSKTGFYYM